jgi:hypothetical protein
MPSTALTIDNEYLSTTTMFIAKEFKDANHVRHAFLDEQDAHWGKGMPQKSGGTRWIQGIGTGTHSSTTRLQTGYEAINLSVAGVLTPAVFSPAHVVRPVLISSEEEELNSGAEQIIEIAGARVKQTIAALMREYSQQAVQGAVTGWEDWSTLNGEDDSSGFLEVVASGSQNNTGVGGLSKVTYRSIAGLQNQTYDVGGAFNSAGLTGLNRLQIDCDIHSDDDTSKRCWLASRSGFENYKRSVQAYERYANASELDAGNLNLAIGGIKVRPEFYMPTAGTNTTADPISFYLIDFADIHTCWSKGKYDGYFGMDDWHSVSGEHDVRMTKIRVRGQLVYRKLSTSGTIQDAETF